MMNNRGKLISGFLMALMILMSLTGMVMKEADAVEMPPINLPPTLKVEDAVGYARVKNIAGVLEVADFWISQISAQMPPGTARMTVGQYIGDPTLEAVDTARPLLLVILNPKKYPNPMVLFLPVKNAQNMQKAIQAKGSFTVLKENTLIVGDDQPSTMKGAEIWSSVKAFSAAPMNRDILFSLDMEKFMKVYSEDIRQKIKNLQSQMKMMQSMQTGQQGTTEEQQKQIEAQVEEMFKMINELKNVAISGDVKKEGLKLTLMAEAKPMTDMCRLFTTKTAIEPQLIKMLPNGFVKFSFSGDPESISEYSAKMSERFMNQAGVYTPEQMQKMKQYQDLQKQILGDEMAVSFFQPGTPGINGVTVYKLKDPAKGIEMIRLTKEQILLANNPAQGLTVTAEFKEKARKVEGIDVHTIKATFSSTNPMMAQQMMMFLPGGAMNLESAVVGKYLATSMGTPIDQALKMLKSGSGTTNLAAFSTFPKGGQIYGDVYILKMIHSIMSPLFAMMAMSGGQNPLDFFAKVEAPPITLFATMNSGKAMGMLDFKFEIIQKVKQGFDAMKQQMAPPPQQQ